MIRLWFYNWQMRRSIRRLLADPAYVKAERRWWQ
jgi:hypothetical protein